MTLQHSQLRRNDGLQVFTCPNLVDAALVEISVQYLYKAGAGDEQQDDIFFEIVLPTGHDPAGAISFGLCCAVKSPRSSTAYSKTVCSGSSLLSNTLTFASRSLTCLCPETGLRAGRLAGSEVRIYSSTISVKTCGSGICFISGFPAQTIANSRK